MTDPHHAQHQHRPTAPYWKRAHRDWRLIVGVLLMFAAITGYIMSNDLSARPRPPVPPQQRH